MSATLELPVQVKGLEAPKHKGAFERLSSLAFPTHRDEVWRRTDPDLVKPEGQAVVAPQSTFGMLKGEAVPAGVTLESIDKGVQHIFSVAPVAKTNLFDALNGVVYQGGTFLKVGKDVSTGEQALFVHHHFKDKGLAAPRSFLHVGAGSSITLVEYFTADDPEILGVPSVEVEVEEGAKFRYVHVNLWNNTARVVPTVHARVKKDAHFEMLFAGFGTRLTKAFFESDLVGEGCKSEVLGIILGQGRQHYDLDAQQNHRVGKTVSDVLCHVALTDRARSVFAGNILCEPGAQQIDGYQQNRNLLLSDKARANSMPRLEIEANDVRCTHGASFATYDRDQKFYLQTRGLTAYEAEHLLVTGFFAAVVERMDHEAVGEWLAEKLEAKMQAALGKSK
ncbi:MAG: Fe-S cluster assembly protein SufD [Candidatus Eremiobacteraeota bacterium]|nr:Fe-S cluster assembly protein SufD [Candidatus Eremiobacteraeota bacterium]MCW5868335.1 Fe-S cluster assembly protein SufD [Candidatus Eremiobacteraeota bacterium]